MSFCDEIKDFWAWWRSTKVDFPSLSKWWDVGKRKIKHIAVHYGSLKKRELRSSRHILQSLADHLKHRFEEGCVSCFDVYKATLLKLADLDKHDAEATKVRARIRWAEEGEMSSSFFLRLEKRNGTTNWFSAIGNDDGVAVSDLDGICQAWMSFYSHLFTKEAVDLRVQSAMLDKLCLFLPESEVPSCEGLFSVGEVFAALQGMARG